MRNLCFIFIRVPTSMQENSTEEWKRAFATAWSQCLAAALKYHSKRERARGESGTPQPWAAMSINACSWQTAHPLHQNTGWQAGGGTYPQIVFLMYRKEKAHTCADGRWNTHYEISLVHRSRGTTVQVTPELTRAHGGRVLIWSVIYDDLCHITWG